VASKYPNIIKHLLSLTGKTKSQLSRELGITRSRIDVLSRSCDRLDVRLIPVLRQYCIDVGVDLDKFWSSK
jgi:hypothetical protein